jgi:hypothetical protein
MQEFMSGKCSDIPLDSVEPCVRQVLENLGFHVKEIRYFTLEGNETQNLQEAKYIRVEATHDLTASRNVTHIFTFALMKHRDNYKVLYLQSAIKLPE